MPAVKAEVPFLDFSPLQNALAALKRRVDSLTVSMTNNMKGGDHDKLNSLLYHAEQQLLTEPGLPRRGWYKHSLYAPGFYTGYGVKTMPAIREAIEQRDWKEAQEQIVVDAASINKLADYFAHNL